MSECNLTDDAVEFLKVLQKDTREYAGCLTKEGEPREQPIYGQARSVSIPPGECPCVFHTHPVGSPTIPSATDIVEQFKHRGTNPALVVTDAGITEYRISDPVTFKELIIERATGVGVSPVDLLKKEMSMLGTDSETSVLSCLEKNGIAIRRLVSF